MPSGHPAALHQQHDDQAQQQIKLCSSCHRPLSVDSPNTPFLLYDEADTNEASIVCGPCRNSLMAHRIETPPVSVARGEYLFAQVERELRRRAAALPDGSSEANIQHPSSANSTAQSSEHTQFSLDEDIDMDASATRPQQPQTPVQPTVSSPSSSSSSTSSRKLLRVVVDAPHHHHQALPTSRSVQHTVTPISRSSSSRSQQQQVTSFCPDPLDDITRLRVRSQGHQCLYPGATFQGTQKSGRNSYDVNVTIVDVDFTSSHLCGYLRIRGLTDDWPELTTYFDAEIIGSRYGFLTRNWGATEQEDMIHWARFPAFRHVRHEMKKPHLTIKDADRGAVFMRWKEKFLVPNHRVQDISGASFAGFYYVCVDFNPPVTQAGHTFSVPEDVPEGDSPMHTSAAKPESSPRLRRESLSRGPRRNRSVSSTRQAAPVAATMSGFYFHQNSEPYQQLSLVHVAEQTSTSFEFR
ncbi:vacuolar import and degradation protein-domain-containing protein [Irpex rosettiformis]|uniref:Vacuolar import and degradation protein-domain-containing protein n=1 Tax=Irpex rosettiformis TaxID=378272 RepID=A0ACB8UHX8_9APHY|nr:vacuolar import and degradation protein-domain-containing protein [Irpex rosettiformis]